LFYRVQGQQGQAALVTPILCEDVRITHILFIMDQKPEVKYKKVKIYQIRERLSITQEELADRLGIAREELSRLENGKASGKWIQKAIKLHRTLKEAGLTLDDLALPPYQDEEK
jgi:DNA-binding XRE family transcriptional regulator